MEPNLQRHPYANEVQERVMPGPGIVVPILLRCPALVCKFPVATEYGSREQLGVLYEVRTVEVQQLVYHVQHVKEQAAQEQDQLRRQLVLVKAEKEHAVLQNTQYMKNLSKQHSVS